MKEDNTVMEVTVPEMLRATGINTAEFMKQVADHIEKLESRIFELDKRLTEAENKQNESK
jgi:hypothetical protein